jgi:UDPglucose 6-dehydrogenase
MRRLLARAGAAGGRFAVVCNPEFLREGEAVDDFLRPHRIVVGCDDPEAAAPVLDLYRTVDAPVLVTDCASAELVKYASNAFLATKVSFVNALAELCEAVEADVGHVSAGMGLDPRIGPEFLHPGPGFGGPCLPKDAAALLSTVEAVGCQFDVLRATIATNHRQRGRMVDKIRRAAGGSLFGAPVAVWGLTFKAGTDDVRDSPALTVIAGLLREGATVRAHDPVVAPAGDGDAHWPAGLSVLPDPYAVCDGAEVLAVLTDWPEYQQADFGRVRALLARPAVVDTRNVVPAPARVWFRYEGVGVPATTDVAADPFRAARAAS